MSKKKRQIREKGKIKLSSYFKNLKDEERVAVVKNTIIISNFPARLIGKTGIVKSSRGRYKEVKIKDGKKIKTFIIPPIHLKKI